MEILLFLNIFFSDKKERPAEVPFLALKKNVLKQKIGMDSWNSFKKKALFFFAFIDAVGDDSCKDNEGSEVKTGAHVFVGAQQKVGECNAIDRFEIGGEHDGVGRKFFHDIDRCCEGKSSTNT